MKESKTGFFCTECGAETAKWSGKCPVCGAWNSLRETEKLTGRRGGDRFSRSGKKLDPITPRLISEVETGKDLRFSSGISEFDRVIGKGFVGGMVVLLGGEPGVGKSTLMLQVAIAVSGSNYKVLYVSGEENEQQVSARSRRLKGDQTDLYLLCTADLDQVLQAIETLGPRLVIIDSIQSVYSEELESSPGSVSQLRECTGFFIQAAKSSNTAFVLIGHVTKAGSVAGPKLIEHMVDTVLYFEGELKGQYKILRTVKNRFGSSGELGIFAMTSTGLDEISNPSRIFLNDKSRGRGTAVGAVIEGTRIFIVEVQALVSPTSYGNPQRVALGIDHRRLAMLLAVIEKNLAFSLKYSDVFINVAGGIRVSETALDLAVAAAIISSQKNFLLDGNTVFLGEIGLNGEIRTINQIEKRLKEAVKLGFEQAVVPSGTRQPGKATKLTRIKNIRELFTFLTSG